MSFEERMKMLENNRVIRFQNLALAINDYADATQKVIDTYKMEIAKKEELNKVKKDAKHNTK